MQPLFNLKNQTISVKRGDRQSGAIQITSDGTTPRDLTGYDFALSIGPRFGDPHYIRLTSNPAAGLSVPDPTNGTILYDLSVANTLLCQQGQLAYDFKQISGSDVETVMSGLGTCWDEVR